MQEGQLAQAGYRKLTRDLRVPAGFITVQSVIPISELPTSPNPDSSRRPT